MSPRYAPDDIDRVRETADIIEVVGEHVRLRRGGRSYKGLCPFHQEKTPSFTVDRDRGLYYCFGCGAGGSVFTFLEQVEGLSFPEAVESLARRYGIELREISGGRRQASPRARLYAVHDIAVERYRELLGSPEGEMVRAYLADRGISEEVAERHRVGFGGWTRDGLVRHLLQKGFSADELLSAGVASRDGRGLRDAFFGRLLFPIFDPSGRPVGFGGRVLPERYRRKGAPDGPKYLNSRETPIFRKSRLLYGTNWARGEILRKRRAVLVEGYTDVIALHAAGFEEAVATCGTSMTEEHMREISTRFGDVRVTLCLDADTAGEAAMSRERTEELAGRFAPGEQISGRGWLPVGRGWLPEVYVANLPEGLDPADFITADGPEGLEKVLDAAVSLPEFLLRRATTGEDLATPEGRARAVRKGAQVLRQVGDPLLRHEYALSLADRVGVDSYEVVQAVERAASGGNKRRVQQTAAPEGGLSGPQRVEREALRVVAASPALLEDEEVCPVEEDFTLPIHRALWRLLLSEWTEHRALDLGRISARIEEEDLRRGISELAAAEPSSGEAGRETLTRLKGFAVVRRIDERKARLRTLDPDKDAKAYDELFEDLLKLERERRTLGSGKPA